MASVLGYQEINIEGINLKKILNLKIIKKINEHDTLYVEALLFDEDKDKCIEEATKQTIIEVKNKGEGEPVLFCGLIKEIKVKMKHNVYYMEIYGVSTTYELDIKKKKRTFQDKQEKYEDMIKSIVKEYSGADVVDVATLGKMKEKFIMQYDETDWEFLKRMASRFNTALIAESKSKKPKFWFGTNVESNTTGDTGSYNYIISKKISEYREMKENNEENLKESDFINYELHSKTILNIGTQVSFGGKILYVKTAIISIKEGEFEGEYLMVVKKGLIMPEILNKDLIGLTLEGKVLERIEDRVKIHFDIDKKQDKKEAFEFPVSTAYTTEGETGFYCMPEEGDHVKLLITKGREEEGIVIGSIRKGDKGKDKISDPDIKFFRTKYGKEIMFNDKEILISGKDNEIFIRITEEIGIELYSKKDVKMESEGNIELNAMKKISISAGSEIGIKCNKSTIKMDGAINIKGTQVKTN